MTASLFTLFLLAFAVSIDSFGTGLAYGIRGLELSVVSLIFISLCSAVSVVIGGAAAVLMVEYVPAMVTEMIGGILLIGIGLWTLINTLTENKKEVDVTESNTKKGLPAQLISILKKPDNADVDKSGTISTKEAILLGTALSLDALGAGIGAALIGLSTWLLAGTVAVMCAVFLAGGMKGGQKLSQFAIIQKVSILPGVLLIALGIWNL
ncbi:sporulation membrane protein YtaF [Alteribacillus iranensis]|uniref:Putative sporulation protein YtaF n=1 Tax=Alteribacillus iranensis TaxID=930128 RepID=A0A1I2CLM7_9BACI|nr:sporulation membrane protein YtaF [Alteribacillus iranensis]SFE68693.1 putative sporulation protein YtaF [Alteribacillus iranensis]